MSEFRSNAKKKSQQLDTLWAVHDFIVSKLKEIELIEDCWILFAVESGSRAWGFESTDSDWDVRFVYCRPVESYLRLDPPRDVIEKNLENDLDVVGWDLTKALKLIHKCNPSIMEWLNTSMIYVEDAALTSELRTLAQGYFKLTPALHHYGNMAKTNYAKHLQKELVSLKKYLYVIRPILACRWLEKESGWPPIEFGTLVDKCLHEPEILREVQALVELKRSGKEFELGPRNAILHNWIDSELVNMEAGNESPSPTTDLAPLNDWFLKVVTSQ